MNFAISPTRMQILRPRWIQQKHLGPGLLHPLLQHEALPFFEKPLLLIIRPRPHGLRRIPKVRKHRGTAATGLAYGRDDHIHSSAFDRLASALRDRRTREYRPGSETTDISCLPPGVSILSPPSRRHPRRWSHPRHCRCQGRLIRPVPQTIEYHPFRRRAPA